jgi:hypothetical protein
MKNPKCPPLAGKKGSPALDTPMKDNPGINTEPDMAASKGPDDPSMKEGYSQGSISGEPKRLYITGFREDMNYE